MDTAWTVFRPRPIAPCSILLVAGSRGVVALRFLSRKEEAAAIVRARRSFGPSRVSRGRSKSARVARESSSARRHLKRARALLGAYFRSSRVPLSLPCHFAGRRSAFDLRVWRELARIRPGAVRTYGEIAAALGVPGAARAVGAAVGRNPIPLILPCHRVVGRGGALTGFSSGLALKALLLEHEGFVLSTGRDLARRRVLGQAPSGRVHPRRRSGTWHRRRP